MTPERIFRLQCQAIHTRKSIAALAIDLNFDPAEMSVSAFINLLDEVYKAPGKPEDFKDQIPYEINTN